MTVIEKVDYLINKLHLSEIEFSIKFRIRKSAIGKWRKGIAQPKVENIAYLCKVMKFQVQDFLNDSSTLDRNHIKEGEHMILALQDNNVNACDEDFPKENNMRYEERD